MVTEEKIPEIPSCTIDDLLRDGGFSNENSHPLYQAFIAEGIQSDGVRYVMQFLLLITFRSLKNLLSYSIPIGFALCYFAYSTWQGNSLFLNSVYVQPAYRRKSVGRLLMGQVSQYAREEKVNRMDLHCPKDNPACEFFKSLGGNDITIDEKWHLFRFPENKVNIDA